MTERAEQAAPTPRSAPRARGVVAASAVILLLALAVRVTLVLTTDRPLVPHPRTDEAGYWQLATNLLAGHGFSFVADPPVPTALRTPGYPVVLAGAFALAGTSLRTGLLASAVADSVTAVLVLGLALGLGTPLRGAAAAGLAWALISPFLWWMDWLYSDALGATFVAAAALAVVATTRRSSLAAAVIAGAAWGAAILVRPFVLPAACASLATARRRAWLPAVAALVAVLAPWAIRNAVSLGRPVLLATGGTGVTLWAGTWSSSERPVIELRRTDDGRLVPYFAGEMADGSAEGERARRAWNAWMAEFFGAGRPAPALEADRALRELAIERIRRAPAAWLKLRLRNVYLAWTLPEMPGGRMAGASVILLAACGVVRLLARGRRREALSLALPVLTLLAVLLPLRTPARYASTAAPLLFALAAVAVPWRLAPDADASQ